MIIESGVELMVRLRKPCSFKLLPQTLFPFGSLPLNFIVDIMGPSGSGKTVLLTELVARCAIDSFRTGSRSKVFVIDMQLHFDVTRLLRTVQRLLEDSNNRQPIVEDPYDILDNVEVVRCFGFEDLCMAVQFVEDTSFQAPLAAVFIDQITALYWLARARQPNAPLYQNETFKTLGNLIKKVNKNSGTPFFITRQEIYRPIQSYKTGDVLDFMGTSWQKLPTFRITTQKTPEPSIFTVKCTGPNGFVQSSQMRIFDDKVVIV